MIKRKQMDQPDDEPKRIYLYCPKLKNGTRDITYCLYRCGKSVIAKCPEYEKVYPDLLDFHVDEKYLEKYGEVKIPIPIKFRKRRKRRSLNATVTE